MYYSIVHHESIIHAYEHPYLFTRSKDQKTSYIWSYSTSTDVPTHVSRVDVKDGKVKPHILSDKFLLLHHVFGSEVKVLLILKVDDGSVCDQKNITPDSNPNDPFHPLLLGDSAFLGAAEGLIAIFVNGSGPHDSTIKIYGISDEGKFVLRNRLKQGVDVPALQESRFPNKQWGPTGYLLPTVIHFTENYCIGAFGDHNIKLVKWHMPSSHPSDTKLHLTPVPLSEPFYWMALQCELRDKVYIHGLDSVILAHYEFPLGFVSQEITTALRSVNTETLELNWCSPIGHETKRLRYNQRLDVLISIGDIPHGIVENTPAYRSVYVLDASTGAIRRQDRTFAHCETSPSGGEIVTAEADGRVTIIPVAAFLEGGSPTEETTHGNDSAAQAQTEAPLRASLRMAAFHPDLESETSLNSERSVIGRNAAAQYAELDQPRPWVDVLFVGEAFVLLGSRGKPGFVVVRIHNGSGDRGSPIRATA